MVFSYNPNFHMHFIGEKSSTGKPINIPNGNIKFFIKKPLRGIIIDIHGAVHCYPDVKPGNYILTIVIEKNNRFIDSTDLVLFIRDKNDDSILEEDLSEMTKIVKVSKKKINKKHNKKSSKYNSRSSSPTSSRTSMNSINTTNKKENKLTNFLNTNNTKYGATIVVFSLLVAFLNLITKN